ncbi:MAG: chloride channel protein, partial [Planctomicrobium sp.]|nr:chloride channel protein [Planctomicrobium sp.]
MKLEKLFSALDWKASGKWTFLSILVGVIAGVGGILFQILGQFVLHFTLVEFAGYAPMEAVGEHSLFGHTGFENFSPWMVVAVMTVGGFVSGWLVYTFAPEAEGHGTDAAIDAYHNKRGRIRGRILLIKTLASAVTLGT